MYLRFLLEILGLIQLLVDHNSTQVSSTPIIRDRNNGSEETRPYSLSVPQAAQLVEWFNLGWQSLLDQAVKISNPILIRWTNNFLSCFLRSSRPISRMNNSWSSTTNLGQFKVPTTISRMSKAFRMRLWVPDIRDGLIQRAITLVLTSIFTTSTKSFQHTCSTPSKKQWNPNWDIGTAPSASPKTRDRQIG